MLRLPVAEAFDAYLVTGGLPLICGEWGTGMDLWDHFDSPLRDSTSALLVSAERALAAECPTEVQARTVLGTIGSGERTFANIGRGSADLQHGSLNRPLQVLIDKRVVAVDQPLSSRSGGKDSRYRVADSYLRFWLAFLGPFIAEVERGRGDTVFERIRTSWPSWRGRTVEPAGAAGAAGAGGGRLLDTHQRPGDRPGGSGPVSWRHADPGGRIRHVAGEGTVRRPRPRPAHRAPLAAAWCERHHPLDRSVPLGGAVEGVRVFGPEEVLSGWHQESQPG